MDSNLRGSRNTRIRIFSDHNGRAIKFHIQPNLQSAVRARLVASIIAHGGLLIDKIPVRGLVVIDPGSRIGAALVDEWTCKGALLPIAEYAVHPEGTLNCSSHAELSEDAKAMLALYLAKTVPDPTLGNRSSNQVYQTLLQNMQIYPWVGLHDWRAFRDQYRKNKRYYDRLIGLILTDTQRDDKDADIVRGIRNSSSTVKRKAETAPWKKIKQINFLESGPSRRKRIFAKDVTNTSRKQTKALKTIDEMLRRPLPSAHRKKRRPYKQTAKNSLDGNIKDEEELEFGRAKPDIIADRTAVEALESSGIWKKQTSYTSIKFQANEGISFGADTGAYKANPQQNMYSLYGIDLDDLRSATALETSMVYANRADAADEERVVELLGLSSRPLEALPHKYLHELSDDGLKGASPEMHNCGSSFVLKQSQHIGLDSPTMNQILQQNCQQNELDAERLTEEVRFIRQEVVQKLAGFSGDYVKTHDFFEHCRTVIERVYMHRSGDSISASVAEEKIIPVRLMTAREAAPEMAVESFPAGNTRLQKKRRAMEMGMRELKK